MAKASRNLLDGKKRQASVLGSTLTSLTLNSENDSTTTSSEEEESVTESDSSHEEDTIEESCQKIDEENNAKSNGRCSSKGSTCSTATTNKKQSGKEKPKVRMKTLTIDGQLVYFCVICDKIFTRKKDKINHQLAHSNETLLSCPECGKDFFHESSLAHHIRSHDGEQLHFCDFCPKMFAQSHQLKAHILSHSNPTEIVCKVCRKNFKTTSDLNLHHRNKIKEEMSALWCSMCKLYCCRIHNVDTHVGRLHAFQCSACNELFCTLKKLKLHAKRYAHKFEPNKTVKTLALASDVNETDDGMRSDSLRESSLTGGLKRNSDQDDLPQSKRSRKDSLLKKQSETEADGMSKLELDLQLTKKLCKSQRKPYCKKCNRSFKESSDLISHKLSAHSSTCGPICRVCGEEFSSSVGLKQHVCKAKLLKPHGCDTKSVREADVPNSNTSQEFECHICAKTFPFHDKLQNHLRLHTNIKSFQCYLCQRIFVTKHYLQRHLQVHIKDGSIAKGDNKRIEDERSVCEIQSDGNYTDENIGRTMGSKSSFKFRLGKENIYSFSDDSASSLVARESDKSDACQLSSASLHSFKISMARERRRLKRKRSLSKSLLCKKLAMKKRVLSEKSPSAEKSVVFVDRLSEGDDSVNNFVVELNGAKSEIDQETTIFVELTLAKLVPKDASVLYSSNGIDKENAIPSCCLNDSILNPELFNKTHVHHSDNNLNDVLSNKIMVLDFEVDDFGAEQFPSLIVKYPEPIIKSINGQQLLPPSSLGLSENPEQNNDVIAKNNQSFEFEYHLQNETPYLQPLHSLHLLTAKFGNENEQSNENKIPELNREFVNKNLVPQDVKPNKPASGKTCRDIAASWKSNKCSVNISKTSSTVNESCNKLSSKHSKENDRCFGKYPKKNSAFNSVSKKSSERQNTYQINESISPNIKKEVIASPAPLPVVNSFAFRSPIKSSQPLPPLFRQSSQESPSFPTHHLSSHTIKSEHSPGQQNHSHHPECSSSISSNRSSYEVKCNIPGSFLSPSIHSAPISSQPHNVFHFDTDNPALRDMNLMEMVCSIQTQTTPTTTVTQLEHPFHGTVSSSAPANVLDFKREIDCETSMSLSRNVKTELTYPPQVDSGSSSRFFGSSINSSRAFSFENPLPSPCVNLNPSVNIINPVMHPTNNVNAFRPSFQQPDWSLQQLPLPSASFPPQGANLINNTFPLLQMPAINNDFNLNRCTYNNVDNLILGHPGNFGLPNPHVPGMVHPVPTLHPLQFGNPPAAVFHHSITPLPLPLPPHMSPAMLPNAGIFYLPF